MLITADLSAVGERFRYRRSARWNRIAREPRGTSGNAKRKQSATSGNAKKLMSVTSGNAGKSTNAAIRKTESDESQA
jgi:hypothetical protein